MARGIKGIDVPMVNKVYQDDLTEEAPAAAADQTITITKPSNRVLLTGIKVVMNTNQTLTSIKLDGNEMLTSTEIAGMSAGDDIDWTGAAALDVRYGVFFDFSGDLVVTYDQATAVQNATIEAYGTTITS